MCFKKKTSTFKKKKKKKKKKKLVYGHVWVCFSLIQCVLPHSTVISLANEQKDWSSAPCLQQTDQPTL